LAFESESRNDWHKRQKDTALVRHWAIADREAHEKMGLHQGWAMCAEQLATLVEKKGLVSGNST
jgi:uncharacterized protein YndB with AHSA1/START domain